MKIKFDLQFDQSKKNHYELNPNKSTSKNDRVNMPLKHGKACILRHLNNLKIMPNYICYLISTIAEFKHYNYILGKYSLMLSHLRGRGGRPLPVFANDIYIN